MIKLPSVAPKVIDTDRCLHSAMKNWDFLVDKYYKEGLIQGPDVGVGAYLRGGRFLANTFTPSKVKEKKYAFQQTQAYFIRSSLMLYHITNDEKYKQKAQVVGDQVVRMQCTNGSWHYPLKEWRDKVVVVDCNWAAMGLLDLYLETENKKYLNAALKWINFLISEVGYSEIADDKICFHYFSPNYLGKLTPNITTLSTALLARMFAINQTGIYENLIHKGLNFIQHVMKPNGEIPYTILEDKKGLTLREKIYRKLMPTDHYQCAQYNAFQLMDLCCVYEELNIDRIKDLILKIASFLSTCVANDGRTQIQCGDNSSVIYYHTSAVGAALFKADEVLSLGFSNKGKKAIEFVLKHQNPSGGFPFSQREYKLFSDSFEYPRTNLYTLYHLLLCALHFEKKNGC